MFATFWAIVEAMFGTELAAVISAVFAFLFALGIYKFVKDWLPF